VFLQHWIIFVLKWRCKGEEVIPASGDRRCCSWRPKMLAALMMIIAYCFLWFSFHDHLSVLFFFLFLFFCVLCALYFWVWLLSGAVGCSVSGLIAAGCYGLLCFWVPSFWVLLESLFPVFYSISFVAVFFFSVLPPLLLPLPLLCSAFYRARACRKTRSSVHQSMSGIICKKSWCRGLEFPDLFPVESVWSVRNGRGGKQWDQNGVILDEKKTDYELVP